MVVSEIGHGDENHITITAGERITNQSRLFFKHCLRKNEDKNKEEKEDNFSHTLTISHLTSKFHLPAFGEARPWRTISHIPLPISYVVEGSHRSAGLTAEAFQVAKPTSYSTDLPPISFAFCLKNDFRTLRVKGLIILGR